MIRLPNSADCFVCGVMNPHGLRLDFSRVVEGIVETHIVFDKRFEDYPGFVHGGMIYTPMLETAGRSLMTEDPSLFVTAASVTIKYREPVPIDKRLRITGIRIKRDRRLSSAKAEIANEQGGVLAELEGLFAPLPAAVVAGIDLTAGGWKVYPDEAFSRKSRDAF